MANTSIYAAFERMWQHVVAALGNKSDANHTHDEYITESEVSTALAGKSDSTHTHDSYETKEDAQIKYDAVENNKMSKANPVGTGSFSMNRKANSTVGEYSHTEGENATASGKASHAEGSNTSAYGKYSHAEGYNTITSSSTESQHVQGKYNIQTNGVAHVVGNGSYISGTGVVRSNAHTMDWDGNAWYAGDVYVGSTSGTNKDEGSKKLATEEFVLNNAGGGSDWSQNDESAKDYIKNRTHWTETGYGTIIEEQTFTLSTPSKTYELTGVLNGNGVNPSQTWKITLNGIEYECQGANGGSGIADCYMGNLALYNSSYTATPEYPFCIYSEWFSMPITTIYFAENVSSFTLKIEDMAQTTTIYHPLEEDYIPDSIARKNYVDNSLKVEEVTSSITSKNWLKVCYGNGKFVAIATSGEIAYSENGVNWTEATLPITGVWRGIAYGNGRFVVAGYNGSIAMYSNDGINWTASALPISEQWTDMTFGNGKFVVISSNSANEDSVASSTDGINWTLSDLPTIYMETVTYGDGKFVAISYNQNMSACSIDGINWTASAMPVSGSWSDVEYGNGKFVAVVKSGSAAAYSVDGINWTASTLPSSQNWVSIGYGNGIFTTVVNNGTIGAYSVDGVTWISTTWTINAQWRDICYGNGKFVAIANQSAIVGLSNNGIEWGKYNRELQNLDGSDRTIAIKHALGISDYNTQVYDIKTQVDSLKSSIFTDTTSGNKVVMFAPLCSNTEYRYVSANGITSLTFNSDASDTFLNTTEAYYFIVFKSGTTATSIINTISINFTGNDCSDGTFAPLSSKTYEMGIWWNGLSWQGIVRAA